MTTRIISGAVLILILIAVLILGGFFPWVLTSFVALVAAIGCYEILNNTKIVKNKAVTLLGCLYSVVSIFAYAGYTSKIWSGFNNTFITVIYVILVVFLSLKLHKSMGLPSIAAAIAFPVVLSFAFSTVSSVYLRESGVFYLLLLLNFSSICDCGAYFTGVFFGNKKLCPEISPKKTVEGALGGIVFSLVFSLIFCLCFAKFKAIIPVLALTVPFCIIGMCGDLFASVIKRSVNLKDYGNLIPGHGGILDRFDSILLIAPVLKLCIDGGLF